MADNAVGGKPPAPGSNPFLPGLPTAPRPTTGTAAPAPAPFSMDSWRDGKMRQAAYQPPESMSWTPGLHVERGPDGTTPTPGTLEGWFNGRYDALAQNYDQNAQHQQNLGGSPAGYSPVLRSMALRNDLLGAAEQQWGRDSPQYDEIKRAYELHPDYQAIQMQKAQQEQQEFRHMTPEALAAQRAENAATKAHFLKRIAARHPGIGGKLQDLATGGIRQVIANRGTYGNPPPPAPTPAPVPRVRDPLPLRSILPGGRKFEQVDGSPINPLL